MGVTFNDLRTVNGCRVLRLESDLLRVDVLPDCGGKIWRLYHKPERREYLWQHPGILPSILPNGANYDDNFCGGWDDCFPCVGPGVHAGEAYPDHGELWTRRFGWEIDSSTDSVTLRLVATGHVTPTRIEKHLTLPADAPKLCLHHRIEHTGDHAFDFLWSQHPALRVGPTHAYIIPAASGVIGSPGMSRLSREPARFDWPRVPGRDGTPFDYRQMPDRVGEGGYEMLYLDGLDAGWYAVIDRASRSGFGLSFDSRLFKTLWIFASHGGWRGLRLAIVEPSTGWPCELEGLAAAGRFMRLSPGQTIETQTTAVILTGCDNVRRIDPQGRVE